MPESGKGAPDCTTMIAEPFLPEIGCRAISA
jgi:hypothetical protein